MEVKDQELTFNIRHDMHEEDWKDLIQVYENMPYWKGIQHDGSGYWFGNENDEIYLKAHITYTGLVIEGNLPDPIWAKWILEFIEKASEALGYEIMTVNHI